MSDSEASLKDIAEAYVMTHISYFDTGESDIAIKTELSRWSLYHQGGDSDWFVMEFIHDASVLKANGSDGLGSIQFRAALYSPTNTGAADVYQHAPTLTMPSVEHSEGVSFNLSGGVGVTGESAGGALVQAGITFDNSNSVSYPGIRVDDRTKPDLVDLTWKLSAPQSTPELAMQTWNFKSTVIFRFDTAKQFGPMPTYNLMLTYTVLPPTAVLGVLQRQSTVQLPPIPTPAARRS